MFICISIPNLGYKQNKKQARMVGIDLVVSLFDGVFGNIWESSLPFR